MEIKKLFTDDSAVSPVIGVILMVAITVILAAVIAAFVLGLGGSDEVSPQTSFSYSYDAESETGGDGALTITVQSGDSFNSDRVSFEGAGLGEDNTWTDVADESESVTVRSGARVTIENLSDDFDINIVWTSSDGDDSAIIGSRSGPDA